jgi:DNA-directed RNA polymerase specialized sigma24 family protein
VVGYFLHWTGSPETAADLTTETFARAYEGLTGFREDRGEPRAWPFGIARHVLAASVQRGKVEDDCRRRLGMPLLAIDDAALERIQSLSGDATAALAGLWPVLRRKRSDLAAASRS